MWFKVLLLTWFCFYGNCTDMGYVIVNGLRVPLTVYTEDMVDARGTYNFYEGEPAHISCRRSTDLNDERDTRTELTVSKSQLMDRSYLSSTYEVNGSVDMYVKLTADHMSGYIDCYFFDYKNDHRSFITILMNLTENPVSVGFQVNGLVLFPIVKDDDQIWYQYEYFDGEELTIQSLKDEHLYGEFECKVDMNPDVIAVSEFKKPWNATNINIITNLKETRNITSVDCFVNYLNSTSRKGLNISLQLIPNTFYYNPFIQGLSMANVLAILLTKISTTIYYEYEPTQVLNLTCCSNTSGVLWEYIESHVRNIGQTTKQLGDGDETMLSAIFKVKPWLTNAHIRCKNLERVTDIELIRNLQEIDLPGIQDEPRTEYNTWYLSINGEEVAENKVLKSEEEEPYGYYYFYDGDQVKILCQGPYGTNLRLAYIKGNQTLVTDVPHAKVEMYIKLTADNDGARVECYKIVYSSRVIHRKRLYLELNHIPREEILGFKVNDFHLTPSPQMKMDGQRLLYSFYYKYYDGESLEIVTLKDEKKFGDIYCDLKGENLPKDLLFFNSTHRNQKILKFSISLKNIHKKVMLECTVEQKKVSGTMLRKNASISLSLVPNVVDPGFYVTGISMENILVQFMENSYTVMIIYDYNDAAYLDLKCYSKYTSAKWNYDSKKVKNLAVNVSNTEVIPELGGSANVLPGSFKLYASQQHATVSCALNRNLKELHDIFVKITRNNDIMMGSVYINEKKMDFGTVMYSEDNVTVYYFYEGELANISCAGNFNRNSLLIQLSAATNTSHVEGRRTITTGTQVNGPGEMKLKLTADYNGGYISCYISDFSNTQQLKILTKLKKEQDVGLKVNGFVLTPIDSVGKKLITYEFLGEEELAIESFKDDERYENILCTLNTLNDVEDKVPVYDDPCHNEEYFPSSFDNSDENHEARMYGIILCNMLQQHDETFLETINDFLNITVTTNLKKKMMLYCSLWYLDYSGKVRLYLNMVRKTIGYSPIIEGLSMSNVSAMYRSKTSNVIRYEYNNQGFFNLTCYSNTTGLQWEYDSYTVEKLDEKALVAEHRHEFTLSAGFKLRFDRTNTRIKCILPAADGRNQEEITEVELIWKPEYNQQPAESPFTADSTWHLMVNGDEVALNDTANTGTEVGAYYYYYDGDQVTILCRDTAGANLKLVYTTKSNQTLQTDPTFTEVEMYIRLMAADDDTHIVCYKRIHNNSSIATKRLHFKFQSSPRKVQLGFIVNELFLTSTPQLEQNSESKVYTFCYKYYEGEQIQIVSVKEEGKYGGVECVFKGKRLPKELQDLDHKQGSYNFSLNSDTKNITLECTVELKTPLDPTLRKNVTILLSLVPNVVDTAREVYKAPKRVNNTKLSPAHHNVISAMFKMNLNQRISTISCDLNRYKHELNEISVTLTRRNNEGAPAAYANWAAMGVSCAVLLVLGASCAAYAVRKTSRETTAVDNRTPTIADTGTDTGAAKDEAVYATIPEHVYEELRPSSQNMAGGMSGVSQRPPQPLPDEAFEENQTNTFVLYDVPYEWRIFRRGVTSLDDRGSWRKYKERQLKGKSRQY